MNQTKDARPGVGRPPHRAAHPQVLKHARIEEPRDIARLATEVEKDYQFQLGFLTVRSLVLAAPTVIEVDGDERARHLARHLTDVWHESAPWALRAFAHGRAAFEKSFRFDRESGLILLAGLDYLPFEQTRLRLDDDGRFAGIDLEAGERKHALDVDRSWWFALDPTATEPHGRSRYLGAPMEVWRERRRLETLERIWYSKFAIGHAVARAPEPADLAPQPDGSETDPLDVLRDRCAEIESGGVLVLSSRTDASGKYLYSYEESEGLRDAGPLENRRRSLDTAALRSLGIPERAITQEETVGSHALALAHREILFRTCEDLLHQLVRSYQRYVIRKLVEWNWPEGNRPRLRLTFQSLGDPTRDRIADFARSVLLTDRSDSLAHHLLDLTKLAELASLPLRPSAKPDAAPLW